MSQTEKHRISKRRKTPGNFTRIAPLTLRRLGLLGTKTTYIALTTCLSPVVYFWMINGLLNTKSVLGLTCIFQACLSEAPVCNRIYQFCAQALWLPCRKK